MKQYMIRWMSSLVVVAALLCGCTEDPEPIAPDFPAQVTATVSAGDVYTLHIQPNTAWRLAISAESATYFYLLEDGSKVYTMRGAAGSYDVQIGVSPIEEFDTERTCEVLLTLGEGALMETRTIAVLTRGVINRDLQLYAAATFDEDASDFVKDESGAYIYGEQPISSLELVKNINDIYLHRIAVVANHAWAFAGDLPAWFTPSVSYAEQGRTEVQLRTNPEAYPFEDTEVEIGFSDMTEKHAPKLTAAKLALKMAGCGDYVNLQLGTQLNFNVEGHYNNEGSYVESGVVGWLNAPLGATIYKAAKVDGRYTTAADQTDWILLTEAAEADATPTAGVWSRKLVLKAQPNEGAAREGILIVVPQTKVASITDPDTQLFTADGTAVHADFSTYKSQLTQDAWMPAEEVEPIEIAELEALRAYGGDFTTLEEGSWIWDLFDVEHAYKMTYASNDSSDGGNLKINVPYATVDVIGFDGSTILQTNAYDGTVVSGADRSWVTVTNSSYGIADQRLVLSRLSDEYPNTCPGDMGENEAFLLFKDAEGQPIALIYFVLDPSFKPGGNTSNTVSFVDSSVAALHGARLAEIVEGDVDFSKEDEAMGVAQYRLIYSKASANEAVLLQVPSYHLLISQNEWLSAEENGDGTIRVVMDIESGQGILNLYNASWQVIVKIICVMDPTIEYDPYDPYGAVTFMDRTAAEALGATLFAVQPDDETYDVDMGYKGIPQYRLTMKKAGTITLKVPTYYISWCYQSWLTCTPDWPEEGSDEATITMTSTGSAVQRSNLTLYVEMSEGTIAAQIQCVLLNEE